MPLARIFWRIKKCDRIIFIEFMQKNVRMLGALWYHIQIFYRILNLDVITLLYMVQTARDFGKPQCN